MSFWKRLGEGFVTVGEKIGDVTTYPTKALSLGAYWGAAKASGDEDQAKKMATGLATETAKAGDSLHTPYSYLARANSATNQQYANVLDGNAEDFFDRSAWTRAWNKSATTTWGQSILDLGRTGQRSATQLVTGQNDDEWNAQFKVGDIRRTDATEEQRQDYYHNTTEGKLTSGSIDFVLNVVGDPLNLVPGGKASGLALKGAERITPALELAVKGERLATEGIPRAERLANDRTNVVADAIRGQLTKTDDMTLSQMMNDPVIRSTSDPAAIASALDAANKAALDAGEKLALKSQILGTAWGDRASREALQANRADLAAQMDRLMSPNELSNAPRWGDDPTGDALFAHMNTEAAGKELDSKLAGLTDRLKNTDAVLASAGSTGQIVGTDTARLGAKIRDYRVSEMLGLDSSIGRPMRMVLDKTAKLAPGYINTKDRLLGSDALRDTLARATGLSADAKSRIYDDFLKAPSQEAASNVVRQAEIALWSAAAKKYDMTPEAARAVYGSAMRRSAGYVNQLKSRAYSANPNVGPELKDLISMVDEDGIGHAFRGPFLRAQLESSVLLSDPKLVDRALQRANRTGIARAMNAPGEVGAMADEVLSAMTRGWKDMALMRLAYPLRIQVDTQLRLMAQMRAQYLIAAADGFKNVIDSRFGRRTVGELQEDGDFLERLAAADRKAEIEVELGHLRDQPEPTMTQTVYPGGLTPEEFQASGMDVLHGTASDIQKFDGTQGGRAAGSSTGEAPVYFTTDRSQAQAYADAKLYEDASSLKDIAADAGVTMPRGGLLAMSGADEAKLTQAVREYVAQNPGLRIERGGKVVPVDENTPLSLIAKNGLLRMKVGAQGKVIGTKAYGKELDLSTFNPQSKAYFESIGKKVSNDADVKREYAWVTHEADEALLPYLRANGFGRAKVIEDGTGATPHSYVALPEYTSHGRDPVKELAQQKETVDTVASLARAKEVNDLKAELGRIDQRLAAPKQMVAATKRRGQNTSYTASDGRVWDISSARTVDEQRITGANVKSSNGAATLGRELADKALDGMKASGEFDIIKGSDFGWDAAYKRAVNQQIRNSPATMAILRGASGEDLRTFVRTDKNAFDEWSNFRAQYGNDLDAWLTDVRMHAESTIPNQQVRDRVLEGQLTDGDMARFFGNTLDRPAVHGEAYVPIAKSRAGRRYEQFRSWWYKIASDMPEEVMGRHPLYVHNFQQNLREAIERVGSDTIDSQLFETLRKQAGTKARRQINEVLFDLSGASNLSTAMRFVSPFYSAWEDTMVKWGKMFYDDPKVANAFYKGTQIPEKADLVSEDGFGNKVIVLPSFMSPPGIAGGKWTMRKDSLNLVFQGADWWNPGAGPLVQLPVNEVLKRYYPEAADAWIVKHAILPFGVEGDGPGTQAAPAYLKRLKSALLQDDSDFANTYAQLYAQEMSRYRVGERASMPTTDEVGRRTRNWFLMRAAVGFSAPISATPSPKYQFYIDQARDYQKRYAGQKDEQGNPVNWQQKFYQDFPDYFDMSISLSANTTGLNATDKAWEAGQKYRDRIAQDPKFGWFYAGADNIGGDFDGNVYTAQRANKIGAGSQESWRTSKDPNQAVKDVETQRGWAAYNSKMTAINLALEQAGYTSINQKGAEQFKAVKALVVQQLSGDNPTWAAAFGSRGSDDVPAFLRMAQTELAKDPTLAKRSDMRTLSKYLEARKAFKAVMASRGTKNLTANQNADLQLIWDAYTSKLVKEDVGFEQQYNRVLSDDDLSGDI